jgi:hypothetical protein
VSSTLVTTQVGLAYVAYFVATSNHDRPTLPDALQVL